MDKIDIYVSKKITLKLSLTLEENEIIKFSTQWKALKNYAFGWEYHNEKITISDRFGICSDILRAIDNQLQKEFPEYSQE